MHIQKRCPAWALVEGLRGGLRDMALLGLMVRPEGIREAWEGARKLSGLYALACQAGRFDIVCELDHWKAVYCRIYAGRRWRRGRSPGLIYCRRRTPLRKSTGWEPERRRSRYGRNALVAQVVAYLRARVRPPLLTDFLDDNSLHPSCWRRFV